MTARKPGSMYGWGYRQKLAVIIPTGEPNACWPVTHGVDRDGYAHLTSNDTSETLVHRLVVMADGEKIPPGHEVDHTCRTRNCANRRHLEVVPKLVNLQRSPRPKAAFCKWGHARTPGNVYADNSCKECKRLWYRAHHHRAVVQSRAISA